MDTAAAQSNQTLQGPRYGNVLDTFATYQFAGHQFGGTGFVLINDYSTIFGTDIDVVVVQGNGGNFERGVLDDGDEAKGVKIVDLGGHFGCWGVGVLGCQERERPGGRYVIGTSNLLYCETHEGGQCSVSWRWPGGGQLCEDTKDILVFAVFAVTGSTQIYDPSAMIDLDEMTGIWLFSKPWILS